MRIGSAARLLAALWLLLAAGCGDDEGTPSDSDAGVDAGVLRDGGRDTADGGDGDGDAACADDDDCDDGYHCDDDVCEPLDCLVGETGCACGPDDTCLRKDDVCQDDHCVDQDCEQGDENCPCDYGSCDAGLFCADDLCVDATGYAGSACLPNNRCHQGYACDAWLDVCVPCEAGTQGCQCDPSNSCNVGLGCVGDICVPDTGVIPEHPKCYTPCSDDNLDGTVRCDADRLTEGCFDGLVCAEGSSSCVEEGQEAPACEDDFECTDYQACLEGHCYSNCEADNDCPQGLGCSRKVCRPSCLTTDAEPCAARYQCKATDGQNGYCYPIAQGGGTTQPTVGGTFTLKPEVLGFTNVRTGRSFDIVLDAEFDQNVTVKKVAHDVNWAVGGNESVRLRDGEDCSGAACPLWWLRLNGSAEQSIALEVPAGGTITVDVTNAGDADASTWDGILEISGEHMDTQTLHLSYVRTEDGRWAGTITYFATFGTDGIDQLQTNPDAVANGFLKRWNAFKTGNTDGWEEFKAIIQATSDGSWDWRGTREDCSTGDVGRCYLYTPVSGEVVGSGIVPYVQSLEQDPIPQGAVDFPFAMDLYRDPFGDLHGRIASDVAMHYPGSPPIDVSFRGDSQDPDTFVQLGSDKVLYLERFDAVASIGGRASPESGNCPSEDFVKTELPWLLPGFTGNAYDDADGNRWISECRDATAPRVGDSAAIKALNTNLAAANPVPDAKNRTRTISLIDGALVNQDELFVIFRERLDPLVSGGKSMDAYGYARMRRTAAPLLDEDDNGVPDAFEGDNADDTPKLDASPGLSGRALTCDPEVLGSGTLSAQISRLIEGVQLDQSAQAPVPVEASRVHYLCGDTGRFSALNQPTDFQNCDPPDFDVTDISGDVFQAQKDYLDKYPDCTQAKALCPSGSTVRYFILKESQDPAVVTGDSCNESNTCADVLAGWEKHAGTSASPIAEGGVEPTWSCQPVTSPSGGTFVPLHCDSDRINLRASKDFYLHDDSAEAQQVYLPIRAAVEEAFRYKTRFTTRSGASVGFAPDICVPFSDEVRYCYDPDQIQQILDRVDCMLDLYRTHNDETALNTYLAENFGVETMTVDERGVDLPAPVSRDGFERLYAELMIMLGDESLTRAYSSRFDLAGNANAAFLGSKFEEGGIDLTGVAGFEMYSLYQAAQYYQSVLDRFYRMTEVLTVALKYDTDESQNFITPETVTAYMDRVIRASTQLAKTWSEVAKRYQSFNRADLSRKVIERAYARTYLESVILNAVIRTVDENSPGTLDAELARMLTDSQLRYRVALRQMRIVYDSLTDDVTFLGFAPDYVPFPALDSNLVNANAFETLLTSVRNKVDVAAQREQAALSANRSLALDRANFQAELTRVRKNYEAQLAEVCGTFVGDDGRVYPAIDTYQHLSTVTREIGGNPCGRLGNGRLSAAIRDTESALLGQKDALASIDTVIEAINIEVERAAAQCEYINSLADFVATRGEERIDVQAEVRQAEIWKGRLERMMNSSMSTLEVAAEAIKSPSVASVALLVLAGATVATTEALTFEQEEKLKTKQRDLDEKNLDIEVTLKRSECETVQIDSRARVRERVLELSAAQTGAARAALNAQAAASEASRLANEAVRLIGEQKESEALSIAVEAARNDPNVRIYRNDAIISADIAFEDALQSMYRLTLVYEYYTSQTYALRDALFLTRMVTAGDYNLQNYLLGLTNAFYEFEELYGNPDQRVMVLSLRDDILRIPRVDDRGVALRQEERLALLHEALADGKWLNEQGYLSFPFATRLDRVSPLTRNHKLLYIESQIFGSSVGDKVARIYLQQTGTGVVRTVADELDYFRMPDRTAVVNPFFASRAFDPSVYRNFRLRDRPLINSTWQLVLNMRDEYENQDIDLQGVDDIWLYFYYTDFTAY